MTRRTLEKTYLGAPIRVYGRHLVATWTLPRGQGRRRKTATPTPEGLRTLERWIETQVAAAAGIPTLTPAQTADAAAALALLPPGTTLAEAARAYCEAVGATRPIPLAAARTAYLAHLAQTGRRPATLRSARHATALLAPWYAAEPAAIAEAEAESIVRQYRNPTTQNTRRAALSGFWNWMIRRRYAAKNPFAALDRALADERPIPIYTPEDAQKLLRTAEKTAPHLVAPLATALFAGVRTSGLDRMTPEDLSGGEIRVPGWASKTRRAYYAPKHPALAAWLRAYAPEPHGPRRSILPGGESRWHAALRRLHAAAGVKPIPNGARHTFASYHYAATHDAPRTASAIGHFGDAETLVRHYRALATPAAAEAYFSLRPSGGTGCNLVSPVSAAALPESQKQPKTPIKTTKMPR